MSNGNRLSIPELEGEIARLGAELAQRMTPQQPHGMYTCTRCGSLYTSVWGCGCPLYPGEKRQAAPQAAPALVRQGAFQLDLTKDESSALRDWIGPDEDPAVTLAVADGHMGLGLYVWATEYPDGGSVLIKPMRGTARNADHLEATLNEERRKFQTETLRTSELSAMLRRFIDKLAPEHTAGPWSRDCDLCRLVSEATTLLDKPINAIGVLVTPAQVIDFNCHFGNPSPVQPPTDAAILAIASSVDMPGSVGASTLILFARALLAACAPSGVSASDGQTFCAPDAHGITTEKP